MKENNPGIIFDFNAEKAKLIGKLDSGKRKTTEFGIFFCFKTEATVHRNIHLTKIYETSRKIYFDTNQTDLHLRFFLLQAKLVFFSMRSFYTIQPANMVSFNYQSISVLRHLYRCREHISSIKD